MKAFVAVTLLAACVAAQTVDQTQTTGLFNPLFWKNTKENTIGNLWNNVWGTQNQYDVKGYNVLPTNTYNTVLSLNQLIRVPLFQTYINLPLFRQHFEHPLFQVYLTTPYFQQYWIYPEFQTFFRNPYLFYKYVYPVVFHTEVSRNGVWEPTNVWNKNVVLPTVQTLNLNNWVNKVQQTLPYAFNNVDTTVNTNKINYNWIMDKIFKDLLVNKPEVTEIKTDVKILNPTMINEEVIRKLVDPITGEIKYFKIVGDKLVHIPLETINTNTFTKPIDTLVEDDLVKDAILKKLYLNKIFGNKRNVEQIFPIGQRFVVPENKYEIFPTLDKVEQIKEQMMMNKQFETLPIDSKVEEITEQLMLNKYDTLPTTFLQGDLVKDAILKKLYLNKIFGNKKTVEQTVYPTAQRFVLPENKYEILPIEAEKLNEQIKEQMMMNKYDTLPIDSKVEQIKEQLMMNKFDTLPITKTTFLQGDLLKDSILKKLYLNKIFGNKQIFPTMNTRFVVPQNKYEILPIEAEKLSEQIKEQMMMNKYETLPMDSVKVQNLNEQVKEEMKMMNKFENVPVMTTNIRNRRNVVYQPSVIPTTYAHQQPIYKNAKNLYTVPLTYGVQTPVTTYNVPATTYNTQYHHQVQPNLYYPGQTIYV